MWSRARSPAESERPERLIDDPWIRIVQVTRAVVSDRAPAGLWPCSSCSRDYEVHEGWLVDYHDAATRRTTRAYVCPTCAAAGQARLWPRHGDP